MVSTQPYTIQIKFQPLLVMTEKLVFTRKNLSQTSQRGLFLEKSLHIKKKSQSIILTNITIVSTGK